MKGAVTKVYPSLEGQGLPTGRCEAAKEGARGDASDVQGTSAIAGMCRIRRPRPERFAPSDEGGC